MPNHFTVRLIPNLVDTVIAALTVENVLPIQFGTMPGLRVFGQRLAFVAGDDLRGIAKIVLVLRILQAMLAWTPTVGLLWLLEATDDNVAATVWQGDNESVAGGGLIDQSDNTTSLSWPCSERNRKDQQTMHLLWSFCVFSAFTIFSSILLESIM